jgi:helicase required for RNAi-mediated heterochromatin assembly 1
LWTNIGQLSPSVEAPAYVLEKPILNISAPAHGDQKKDYERIDVTQEWPAAPSKSLDDTQWEALQQIITKRLAIIQGPPGTGKTYVSKIAVEIIHANRKPDDPPMIVAAQTNHALDQLLGHISAFEPNYIRLGGRSTNPEVKKRALFEIRQNERIRQLPGGLLGKSNSLLSKQTKAMTAILDTLAMPGRDPFSTDQVSGPQVLLRLGVLNAQQAKSLEDGATQWVSTTETVDGPIHLWLGRALVPFEVKYAAPNYGFDEVEDNDPEFDQLKEMEDSTGVNDEEDIEMLKGPWLGLRDKFTVRPASSRDLESAAKKLDTVTDLWKVPDYLRGPMYSIIRSRAMAAMAAKFREGAATYEKLVKDSLVGKWEQDAVYLQRAPIIGMTTTGLSKYRPLLSALKPKIVIVEEAAEVLEAPVVAACLDSLEHLILVGDHQQLQVHCSIQELEGPPFNLSTSLFERLVRNNMPFKKLLCQRRMDPEFRRLIAGLYPDLTDHSSVIDRPIGPWGMSNIKSFFFDHQWSEYKDESLSTYNAEEAKVIAGFYRYLNKNGVEPEKITVLTFYNGQRKRILKELRNYPDITAGYLQVKTVDSYQGEENDIVILSLVRSNEAGNIGFLANPNRVCVALSRAKYGFYLFGNSRAVLSGSELWYNVVTLMESSPKRLGHVLPVRCKNHGTTTLMQYPEDWQQNEGGCTKPCDAMLQCGHHCPFPCHPYSHDKVKCQEETCVKVLECGHACARKCAEACYCPCAKPPTKDAATVEKSEEDWSAAIPTRLGPRDVRAWTAQGCNVDGQNVLPPGSAFYLQAQSPASRNVGPSYRDAVAPPPPPTADPFYGPASKQKSSPLKYASPGYRTGGAWNPTPAETIKTHRLSPAKQLERQNGWKDFAQGGVVADDQRLGGLTKSHPRVTGRTDEYNELSRNAPPLRAPPPAFDRGQAENVRNPLPLRETVEAMSGGRSRYMHEYRHDSGHSHPGSSVDDLKDLDDYFRKEQH